jgi:tripartite-type tricarboxylate transporter receptor subunit TctC
MNSANRLLRLGTVLLTGLLGTAAPAMAQEVFPSRPLRIVVNVAPGGLTDVTTRLVAQRMSEALGQPVVVENRTGADGLVGIRYVKTVPADGYTMLGTAGTVTIQPSVKLEPGYDLVRDFTGIGPMIRSPVLMLVGADTQYRTLQDFVASAKANPGQLTYASAGVGSTTHLGAALFLRQAGLQVLHVPYRGNAAAMPDVLAGRVSFIFEGYGSSVGSVRDGKLRPLAVTSTSRLATLPEVPTIAEQGVPGFNYYLWLGLLAPAGTPPERVAKLSQALQTALSGADFRERMRVEGSEPMPMSPEAFNDFLRQELANNERVVRELGILRD